MSEIKKILVTGATGYVGTRLIPRLLDAGYQVKTLARSLSKLENKQWAQHPNIELIEADILNYQAICRALNNCDAAYYLIHSMNPQNKNFVLADRNSATNMINAADDTGLQRIIYLGGLGEQSNNLSKHLHSRAEVAQILQSGKTKTTVLRAAMIIGSGSASFEILRYLVERLPIMITPRWVFTPSQPIAIRNVLNYLIDCLKATDTIGKTFDIGGPEILTYRDLIQIYAQEAGLKHRIILPVPVFSPKLSSYWIHLITPVPAYIARPLTEGLKNPAVCQEGEIRKIIPQDLITAREAIRLALNKLQANEVESHWTDAGIIGPAEYGTSADPSWSGGTIFSDKQTLIVKAHREEIWKAIISIGGDNGWYHCNWLWSLRGMVDRLLGGVGLRRGRRHPVELKDGDCLDFWRVKEIEPGKRLLLVAEMKLPGKATLEYKIRQKDNGQIEIQQIARFLPRGLFGLIYWYSILPIHSIIFGGILPSIARSCNAQIIDKSN